MTPTTSVSLLKPASPAHPAHRASPDANLFAALRALFPADLQACAVETDTGLHYSWQDLDEATAMVANLLGTLKLVPGSRVVAQVKESVEAMVLYLATLRAGLVYVPLNAPYQQAAMAYFIADAQPAVVVCGTAQFGWASKMAFSGGCASVFTLNGDRTGSLLARASHCARTHAIAPVQPDDLAAIIYTSGTTGRSKAAMLSHGDLLAPRGNGCDTLIHFGVGSHADLLLVHLTRRQVRGNP